MSRVYEPWRLGQYPARPASSVVVEHGSALPPPYSRQRNRQHISAPPPRAKRAAQPGNVGNEILPLKHEIESFNKQPRGTQLPGNIANALPWPPYWDEFRANLLFRSLEHLVDPRVECEYIQSLSRPSPSPRGLSTPFSNAKVDSTGPQGSTP